MTTILQLTHLSKSFGAVQAVSDLSLAVESGEIFGFLGPNGAGKTTTISMICGLLKPDSGEITLNGHNGDSRTRIGVCPQTITIWDRLTCLESLEFIGAMYDVPHAAARQRGQALLEAFGLAEKRDKLAATLSGGMQRRLNLALALVHDPDLLVLDEPEAGLDPQSRVLVREFIQNWAHERLGRQVRASRTVIFTTHNMDEAERLVDRVSIIDHGRLLVLDTPAALKRGSGQGDVLEMEVRGISSVLTRSAEGPRTDEVRGISSPSPLAPLQAAGLDVQLEGDHLHIRCGDGMAAVDALPLALESLRAAGLPPAEVRLREPTLEDVFIRLTGRRLRE